MARKSTKDEKREFGNVRRLPSGRYQARYMVETGGVQVRHRAPVTFVSKEDAQAWLTDERRALSAGTWTPPAARAAAAAQAAKDAEPVLTFGAYAPSWLEHRLSKGQPLKPRTRDHYAKLIAGRLTPEFGAMPLDAITPAVVRAWYDKQDKNAPTMRAHAYALLRTIMGTAVEEDLIRSNPCTIKGGQHAETKHRVEPASLSELGAITKALPEKYRALALLAAWCAFRFGELAELRRKDVDLVRGVIRVRRGAVRLPGENGKATVIVGDPKSVAGVRDVAIPPHIVPAIKAHLSDHAQWGQDGLLFPNTSGGNLSPHTFYRHWHKATEAAGRPDLHVHDLRHTGAVLAAQTGATLAELMARLGHSTPAAAMRYQHAAAGRDKQIAAALSQMVGGVS